MRLVALSTSSATLSQGTLGPTSASWQLITHQHSLSVRPDLHLSRMAAALGVPYSWQAPAMGGICPNAHLASNRPPPAKPHNH